MTDAAEPDGALGMNVCPVLRPTIAALPHPLQPGGPTPLLCHSALVLAWQHSSCDLVLSAGSRNHKAQSVKSFPRPSHAPSVRAHAKEAASLWSGPKAPGLLGWVPGQTAALALQEVKA